MKKYGLLFLLALTFATPGSARQMICKLEQDYLEKAYGYSYASLDTESGDVRLGNGKEWTKSIKSTKKKIAVGEKYTWKQVLHNTLRKRDYHVRPSIRVLKNGKVDMYVESWKIPLRCK